MKRILVILLLLMSDGINAQQNPQPKMLHNFGGNDGGILMLDNNRFALWGYATFVPGSYIIQGDVIHFTPDVYPTFTMAARNEPALKNKLRIRFEGFERNQNFIQLDDEQPIPVFNEGANCFGYPFIAEFNIKNETKIISFTTVNEVEGFDKYSNNYSFPVSGNNDFIVTHHQLSYYQLPFVGKMKKKNGETTLSTEHYGNFRDNTSEENVDELLSFFETGTRLSKEVFINRDNQGLDLETEPVKSYFDINDYAIDTNKNILKYKGENLFNPYNDEIRRYQPLQPVVKNERIISFSDAANTPVFFTTCEDAENSYQYKSQRELKAEKEMNSDSREIPILKPTKIFKN